MMKTIGMIGGLSWESSAHYYSIINRGIRARLGGLHSARSVMFSFDFSAIADLQHDNDWATLTQEMCDAARAVERGGADFVMICTNTMHRVADEVIASVSIPLLHIVDPTARAIQAAGLQTVGLLGTAFTMEQEFYKGRMRAHFGLDVVVPDGDDRKTVHRIIYEELVQGRIEPDSRAAMRDVMARLVARGAQGIVLGCTELMILVSAADSAVPLFDTTVLHAEAAVKLALGDDALRLHGFDDHLAQDFHDINAEWIESMFALEDTDREVLEQPRERIIATGGDILFVEAEGKGIIGTCALQQTGPARFELTKMGVRESARGLKAGAFLLDAAIKRAEALGATTLYLLTNSKCAAAIHLYEKHGFVHDAGIMRDYGARYGRCDVAMRYVGNTA